MPRHNRPRRGGASSDPEEPSGTRGGFLEEQEQADDGDWIVRPVTGAAATKTYRCPGCDHEIAPGVPHLVTWPVHGLVDDRRHWHRACWNNRGRRRITRRAGR